MNPEDSLCELQEEWQAFLAERGHSALCPKEVRCVLQSRNAGGKRYRWLLLTARGKSKTFNRFELDDLAYHEQRARKLKQTAYVVLGFQRPQRKVMVVPVDKVLRNKRVLPTKGGLVWRDGD